MRAGQKRLTPKPVTVSQGQKGSWSQQGNTGVSAWERTHRQSPASVRPLSLSSKGTT